MDKSELLHKFFDGIISASEEHNLFSILSVDSSLRREFKNYLEIEKAAKSDFATMIPSVATTSTLFNKLNVASVPLAASIPFWTKYRSIIATNVATFILASAIMFLGLNYFKNTNADTQSQVNYSQNSGNPQASLKVNENQLSNFSNSFSTSASKISNDNLQRNQVDNPKEIHNSNLSNLANQFDNSNSSENSNLLNNSNQLNNTHLLTNNSTNTISNTDDKIENEDSFNIILDKFLTNSQIDLNDENAINQINYKVNNPLDFENQYSNFELSSPDYTNVGFQFENFTLSFNGADYWSIKEPTVQESSHPFFSNNSVNLAYNINDNFALGADYRRENFFQEYKGYGKDEKLYLYEQNTNYAAYGITARYNFLLTNYLKPFLQTYLGGNKVGPIGRFIVGFEVIPTNHYGFIVSLEGSSLGYFHQDNMYFSNKIGLHYGVVLNF